MLKKNEIAENIFFFTTEHTIETFVSPVIQLYPCSEKKITLFWPTTRSHSCLIFEVLAMGQTSPLKSAKILYCASQKCSLRP